MSNGEKLVRELQARSAREQQRDADREAKAARQQMRTADRREAARKREQQKRGRAPVGFWQSREMWLIFLAALMLGVVALVFLYDHFYEHWQDPEESLFARWGHVLSWSAVLLGLYSIGLVCWFGVWRKLLRFELVGYDSIAGRDKTGELEVPWVAFRVAVTLKEDDAVARAAVRAALEILAARATRFMKSDDDAKADSEHRWHLRGDLLAFGKGSRGIFVTGLLRRWLLGELNRVARRWPIERVEITARYTGDFYRVPSETMTP